MSHYPEQTEIEFESNPWLGRIVWVIVGFNVGFLLPTILIFLLLPLIAPDFAPRRTSASASPLPTVPQVAYVVISPIPSETPPPTATPTEAPTALPTEEAAPDEATAEVVIPTETPWPTATPLPPTPTQIPATSTYNVEGITFQKQTWNNCGPANLAMALSYFDWEGTQVDTARYLKPDREDKNVSPDQMVAYVNENTNLRATYRVAGTLDMLRWLVSNGFIVIIESGYQPPNDEWYGHYFTVGGYDATLGEFYLYDSNLGTRTRPRTTFTDAELERNWRAFNHTYLVLYPPEREGTLQGFLGPQWYMAANWRVALDNASAAVAENQEDAYAWFNVGTSLTMLGEYERAGQAFDQSFFLGMPRRMLWYQFGPYEAYFQSSRLDDVVGLAQSVIANTPYVEEAYYYLGRVAEVRGDLETAQENYKLALRYNSNYRAAEDALARVESAL